MKSRLLFVVVAVVIVSLFIVTYVFKTSDEPLPTDYDAADPSEVLNAHDRANPAGSEVPGKTSSKDDRMGARQGPRHRIVEPDAGFGERADAGQPAASASDLEPRESWVDPVNQKVLGEPSWMAEPPKEMAERVEAALAERRDNPEERRLENLDRRSAIDAVGALVTACVEAVRERNPEAYGRVSVVFDFETSGEFGTVTRGRVGRVWKLDDDPDFVSCVEADLQGLTFEARTDSARATVEYPFFFEDS